jgi:UTP--glucose-1-phosphate uridylyltransferase
MVHKTVIPAAGLGTRMLPAAKAIPKEMLPILDRPTIQYVVEEAASAGVDDVLLVTSRDKRAIEDHFDHNAELEQRLAGTKKQDLLSSISELMTRVHVHSVRQPRPLGLGHAILCARDHVGKEPFLCQLGDAIFSGAELPARQLIDAFSRLGTGVIGVEEVPLEKVGRYGVVGGTMVEEGVIRIRTLVEKPEPDKAPSRLAIAARYILTPAIFDCLERTAPGAGGEIQLTDALVQLLQREPLHAVILKAKRHDIGNKADWLATNLLFARWDERLWEQLAPLARSLLGDTSG